MLTLINKRQIVADDFEEMEDHAIVMRDSGRTTVIQRWQEAKQEVIQHPFLKEKVQVGLLPYIQALLLARYLRGDLDAYPPFFKR